MHFAAASGLSDVVSYLLGIDPALSSAVTTDQDCTALHYAATDNRVEVAKLLLASNPGLINAVARSGQTALHCAAFKGHNAMVLYLLTAGAKEQIDSRTLTDQTALHLAALSWDPKTAAESKLTAETLLAMKPELISMKDNTGNTALHFLAIKCQSREFVEHMWRLYPEALRAGNEDNSTPFHLAVSGENDCAIELFQWGLTWEEIKEAYDKCEKSYVERFKPVLGTQCEGLSELLLPEVVETVFEYLGFQRVKHSSSLRTQVGVQTANPL